MSGGERPLNHLSDLEELSQHPCHTIARMPAAKEDKLYLVESHAFTPVADKVMLQTLTRCPLKPRSALQNVPNETPRLPLGTLGFVGGLEISSSLQRADTRL